MSPIRHVVECGIYAEDLDGAGRFYGEVLGLECVGKEQGHHVFFRVGSNMLLVFDPRATIKGDVLPAHGATGPTHFALGIEAEALAGWRARLEDFGIAIEREVTWPRGGHSLYFRDPAGNAVELVTPGVWGLPSGW